MTTTGPDAVGAPDPLIAVEAGKRYNAFISYSHDDGHVAKPLQTGLQRLGKHWRQRRILEVFRDETSLAANPHLWKSICQAIDGSDWLVLLCSPKAARSEYVGYEIERWLRTKDPLHILPVVTSGTFTWDPSTSDFAWHDPEAVTAVPPKLRGVFREVPFHIDMTWVERDAKVDLDDAKFRNQVAKLAAPMHGVEMEDLESEELRQQRRVHRITRAAIALLATLTLASVVSGSTAVYAQRRAVKERDRATAEARRNLAEGLAARARAGDQEQPDVRLLRAVAADRIESTPATQAALLRSLLDVAEYDVLLSGHAGSVIDLVASGDGSRMATADASGQVRVWSGKDGKLVAGPLDLAARQVLLDADGATLVTVDRAGTVTWSDAATGDKRHEQTAPKGAEVGVACDSWSCRRSIAGVSPDGETVVIPALVDEKQWVVQFAGPDRKTATVEVDAPISGLLWAADGTLLVSDDTGIQMWEGDEGPDGTYGFRFDGAAGMVPGGVDYVGADEGGIDGRDRPVLTLIRPGQSGNGSTVEWLEVAATGRRWQSVASRTSAPSDGSDFTQASFGALAAIDHSRILVGTDPQFGGPTIPSLYFMDDDEDLDASAYLDAPAGAVTRIATAAGGRIAIAGLDPVVRVTGAGDGLLATVSESIEETALVSSATAAERDRLPVVKGREVIRTSADHERGLVAGVYATEAKTGVASVYGRVGAGPVRIVDQGGKDVTPESLETAEVTTVSFDPETGELLTGTRSGAVVTYDPETGDVLDRTQATDAPIHLLERSPDGRFLLVATTEELLLLDGGDATTISTLVARRRADRIGSPPQFEVPSMLPVQAGFSKDGSLRFGWSATVADSIGGAAEFPAANGPFGDTTVSQAPVLPMNDVTIDGSSAGSVELRLDRLADRACGVANRDMTDVEWERLAGEADRPDICPDLEAPPTEVPAPLERLPVETSSSGPDSGISGPGTAGEDPGSGPFDDGETDPGSGDVDDATSAEQAEKALVEYIDGEGERDGIEYLGSCIDYSPADIDDTESCHLILDNSSGQVVYAEISGNAYRLIGLEGPRPWSVFDTWDPADGDDVPEWATKAKGLLELQGQFSGTGGGSDTTTTSPFDGSGDVFTPEGD